MKKYLSIIVFLLIYGFAHFAAHRISSDTSAEQSLAIAFDAVFWLVVFFYLRRSNGLKKFGICMPKGIRPVDFMLLLLPMIQFCYQPVGISAAACLYYAEIAFAEEMLFRSVLPRILHRYFKPSAYANVLVCGVIFGVLHAVNLFAGDSLSTVLVQVVYASCAGVCFAVLKCSSGSIFPPFLLHTLMNCTAPANYETGDLPLLAAISTAFLLYSCYRLANLQKEKIDEIIY